MFFEWLSTFTYVYILYDPNSFIGTNVAKGYVVGINAMIQSEFGNNRPAGWHRRIADRVQTQIAGEELDMVFRYCQNLITDYAADNSLYVDACRIVSFSKAMEMLKNIHHAIKHEPGGHKKSPRAVAAAVSSIIADDWAIVLAHYCEYGEFRHDDHVMELSCQVIALLKKPFAENRFKQLQQEILADPTAATNPSSPGPSPEAFQPQPLQDYAAYAQSVEDILMDDEPESVSAALDESAAALEKELQSALQTTPSPTTAGVTSRKRTLSENIYVGEMVESNEKSTNTPLPHIGATRPKKLTCKTFKTPFNTLTQLPIADNQTYNAATVGLLQDMSDHIRKHYTEKKKRPTQWLHVVVRKYKWILEREIKPMFTFCQNEIRNTRGNTRYLDACMVVSNLRALCEFSKLKIVLMQQSNQSDHQALVRQAISREWQSVLIDFCRDHNEGMRAIVKRKEYENICWILYGLKASEVTHVA